MSTDMPINPEMIRRLYNAYNDQYLASLAALIAEDVNWPDGPQRLRGQAAAEDYWSHQWARIHTHDEVTTITYLGRDRSAVRIRQVVRNLNGAIISIGEFEHIYQFRGGLVERMDLRKL